MHDLPVFRSLRATPVLVPLPVPLKTASGIIDQSPLVLVDLETTTGIVGHAYVFVYTPLALAPVVQAIDALAKELAGAVVAPDALSQALIARFRLLGTAGLLGMALAGIEMAAWDVVAKGAELPLWRLLGGAERPVKAYASFGMDGIEQGQRLAADAVASGFRAVKFKLGYATLAQDLEVARAIREAVGPVVELMVDYNQSLSLPEAIRRCRALDGEGLAWIEEPTLQEDYAGHARIAATVATPIQIGENWFGLSEMTKALEAGASDLVMPDVMKIGGISAWRGAATLAQSRSLPISTHLFHEVSAHLMTVAPTAHYLEVMDLASPVLKAPMRFDAGHAVLPLEPGVGLAWDSEAVARYRVA